MTTKGTSLLRSISLRYYVFEPISCGSRATRAASISCLRFATRGELPRRHTSGFASFVLSGSNLLSSRRSFARLRFHRASLLQVLHGAVVGQWLLDPEGRQSGRRVLVPALLHDLRHHVQSLYCKSGGLVNEESHLWLSCRHFVILIYQVPFSVVSIWTDVATFLKL